MSKIGRYLSKKPERADHLRSRLLANSDIDARGCRIWRGPKNKEGYGRMYFQFKGGGESAHRAAYVLFRGEIPDGMFVLHECDNPSCINPDHLRIGTNADNMRDASMKGRLSRQFGSKSGKAKLTEGIAIAAMKLIAAGETFKDVAKRYNVSHFTLRRIKDGSRWPHLRKAVLEIFGGLNAAVKPQPYSRQ